MKWLRLVVVLLYCVTHGVTYVSVTKNGTGINVNITAARGFLFYKFRVDCDNFTRTWERSDHFLEDAFVPNQCVMLAVTSTARNSTEQAWKFVGRNETKSITDPSLEIHAWQEEESDTRLPSIVASFIPGTVHFHVKVTSNITSLRIVRVDFHCNETAGLSQQSSTVYSCSYESTGKYHVYTAVDVEVNGVYSVVRKYKSIIIHEPIEGLKVFGEENIVLGETAPFHVSCTGSNPVSFCWYVTMEPCALPRDQMCSPTLMSNKCQVSFNHTFKEQGNYCVNVSAINTVGYENIVHFVDVKAPSSSTSYYVTLIPVVGVCVLLIVFAVYVVRMSTVRHRKRRRETEEAIFDFRRSQSDDENVTLVKYMHPFRKCAEKCFKRLGVEDSSEDEETSLFHDTPPHNPVSRKVSYYGTVHRTLLQKTQPIVADLPPQQEVSADESPPPSFVARPKHLNVKKNRPKSSESTRREKMFSLTL